MATPEDIAGLEAFIKRLSAAGWMSSAKLREMGQTAWSEIKFSERGSKRLLEMATILRELEGDGELTAHDMVFLNKFARRNIDFLPPSDEEIPPTTR